MTKRTDEQIEADWTRKRSARLDLLDRAQRSVAYWARRAGSARGRQMLREAVARRTLRQQQVAEADRVINRHGAVDSVSAVGIALVAGFEAFRSRPYKPIPGDPWTIGYGETSGVTPRTGPWTRAYALARLRRRLNGDYLQPLLDLCESIGLRLTQREADAIASFLYNLGTGKLAADTVMGKALRSKDRKRIAAAFLYPPYASADGRVLVGLERRRRAERAMFLRG